MFRSIRRFLEAKKIVDVAQRMAINTDDSNAVIQDQNLGFHLEFNPNQKPERMKHLIKIMGREFPYRAEEHGAYYIKIPGEKTLISPGNELENNINETTFSPEDWKQHVKTNYELCKDNFDQIASPALMTIKQAKEFWPKIVCCEVFFSYWCLNSHIPGFIRRKESGIGDYFEIIKTASELIKFREATTKPIIFTELGNGEYHYACTRPDVTFLYWLHKLIFKERFYVGLYYNSSLMERSIGYDQIKKR